MLLYLQAENGSPVQTGIVGLMSAAEYDAGKIKKHELTRKDKEEDRIKHVTQSMRKPGRYLLVTGNGKDSIRSSIK